MAPQTRRTTDTLVAQTAVRIRCATNDDHAALAEQFLGLNRHEGAISKDRRTDRRAALESLSAAWQLVKESDGAALVAEVDGRIVGHLFLLFKEDAVFIQTEPRTYAYVSELFVRPEARGAGIATALMQEAERRARAKGIRRLMLDVLAGNALAEALYRRLGFAAYSTTLIKQISPA